MKSIRGSKAARREARRSAARHRPAENEDQDGARHCSGEIETHGRGQVEEDEPVQVRDGAESRYERVGRRRPDEGPEPEIREQSVDEGGHARHTPPSSSRSGNPRIGGRQPAPKPTHPAASIWNGNHGPTPPVINPDAKNATAPRTNPNPRPKTRAASIEEEPFGLEAVDAGARHAQCGEARRQDPEQRHRLGVDRSFGELGHDDGQEERQEADEDPGRITAVGGVLASRSGGSGAASRRRPRRTAL